MENLIWRQHMYLQWTVTTYKIPHAKKHSLINTTHPTPFNILSLHMNVCRQGHLDLGYFCQCKAGGEHMTTKT